MKLSDTEFLIQTDVTGINIKQEGIFRIYFERLKTQERVMVKVTWKQDENSETFTPITKSYSRMYGTIGGSVLDRVDNVLKNLPNMENYNAICVESRNMGQNIKISLVDGLVK